MNELLQNEIFFITLTFLVFWGAKQLQYWTHQVWLNPILVTILVMIVFLKLTGIPYESYHESGRMIDFWLKPAIVALGVPLYQQLGNIRRSILPILLSQLVGCIVGVVSVVLLADWMGASREIIMSLAPKSVTTPIAMEVTSKLGGIPSLTAAIVICVGLVGGIFGWKILEIGRIRSTDSQGLSIGAAAHAVGTSRAMEKGADLGAYATLGLIINGVLTAFLTPYILAMMGY